MGLWIVKQIAAAHGGSIRVESKPGEGAEFTVDLPRDAR
jgi:signal transduction histidine kinase